MRILTALLLCALVTPVYAATEVLDFDSPAQESLYKDLTEELRCTVCQNQNIADSNAELAGDLRRKTYKMVREGKTRDQIKDFMVQRYGNFVLYDPPMSGGSLLLWIGPFLLLLVGVYMLLRVLRRRRAAASETVVEEDNLDRARTLLRGEDEEQS